MLIVKVCTGNAIDLMARCVGTLMKKQRVRHNKEDDTEKRALAEYVAYFPFSNIMPVQ